jgi:two-component system chemotaxis response regulator CheB
MTTPETQILKRFYQKGTGAIVIGASAGGVEAVNRLISKLPKQIFTAIIVLIHLPEGKKSLLPEVFSLVGSVRAKEVEDKEAIEPGRIYTAPADYHLLIEEDRTFSLSNEDPVNLSRPSIDVLFESAAYAYKEGLVGIVLTGASADGAAGLKVIKELGGLTIVQNPATALSATMPKAAVNAVSPELVMNLDEIAEIIAGLCQTPLK